MSKSEDVQVLVDKLIKDLSNVINQKYKKAEERLKIFLKDETTLQLSSATTNQAEWLGFEVFKR